MTRASIIALMLLGIACGRDATAVCTTRADSPIIEITRAGGQSGGAPIDVLYISAITLDGAPVDASALRIAPENNTAFDHGILTCTVPCAFGDAAGTYSFDVDAPHYSTESVHVVAAYDAAPAPCPASLRRPTSLQFDLREVVEARVGFSFAARRAVTLPPSITTIVYDDGTGAHTFQLSYPWPAYETANTGTLHVRVILGAPDTIAVGTLDLPLHKDWQWGIGAYLYDTNPKNESFCIDAKSFPLRRPVPGADSLWIVWSGAPISIESTC